MYTCIQICIQQIFVPCDPTILHQLMYPNLFIDFVRHFFIRHRMFIVSVVQKNYGLLFIYCFRICDVLSPNLKTVRANGRYHLLKQDK